ncbi:MAG: DNA helicase RecG, partial [Armatimonadetes bacterium]|nr:DNA helicase RecG [Armatimonadota bacterium]
ADFDISVIDEVPPGRHRVITRLVEASQRDAAYRVVRERVAAGQQAFVICPLIEPSETLDAEAAVARFEQLREGPLCNLRLGLVHGRLPTPERQAVMEAFYEGRIDVLVSTTVIEVGLDVPSASVIVIESAERFGLAQLHQLRGRVARSRHTPICFLVCGNSGGQARDRLAALVRHSDGLKIAEIDLRLRGAGELAGLRQHGATDMVIGNVLQYPELLLAARAQAEGILRGDPNLAKPEHAGLAEEVAALGQIEAGRWAL